MSSASFLDRLLSTASPPGPVAGVEAWWERHRAVEAERPFDQAVLAAGRMDRVGYAFASGYCGALARLVPELRGIKAALCASEEGGVHPRDIQTRLRAAGDRWTLQGTKTFVTLGAEADVLLVVASEGRDESGRNRLAVVRVPRGRGGVTLTANPPTPFAPEIPHARLELDGVRVEAAERLAGDGYAAYLKPFRTVEDVFVHGALLAYVVQVARGAEWPHELIEEGLALLCACRDLAAGDPASAALHVALGGVLERTRSLLREAAPCWGALDEETRSRWERDCPLLEVAGSARRRRLERAWERLRSSG